MKYGVYENYKREYEMDNSDREKLINEAKILWEYFDNYCAESTNYLPPDKIEYFNDQIVVSYKTSPTNIGLMFGCTLASRDFGLITTDEMCLRLQGAINSIKSMDKWKGHLYNWYDIKTLKPLSPNFVSTVDSGNFICALEVTAQGIQEYEYENEQIIDIVDEINNIVKNTDIKALFSFEKNLFHVGYDEHIQKLTDSYYDQFICENSLLSYYSICNGTISQKHWRVLSRIIGETEGIKGYKSWGGTMFEYFMPHLFIPAYNGTDIYDSLRFCLHCQKVDAKKNNYPYGISESAYGDRSDNNCDYKYKAHGVSACALSNNVVGSVISPYSVYLTLSFDTEDALKNLERLKRYKMRGNYGYFEAIDFCVKGKPVIVKSYMAHHVGMSMLSIINATHNNIMQARFMRIPNMENGSRLINENNLSTLTVNSAQNNIESNKVSISECLILVSMIAPDTISELLDIISKYKERYIGFDVGFSLNYLDSTIKYTTKERDVYVNASKLNLVWIRERVYDSKNKLWTSKNKKYGGIENVIIDLRCKKKYKYIMLLDSDTYIDRADIFKMLAFANAHPEYNIYSPKIEQIYRKSDCKYLNWINEYGYKYLSSGDVSKNNMFYGKGLISIDRFNMISDYFRLPILSHDIIESGLNRCVLIESATAFEEMPKSIEHYFSRLERWMRGDFQNFPYLFSKRLSINCKKIILNNIIAYLKNIPISTNKNIARFKIQVFFIMLKTLPKSIYRIITKTKLLEWEVYS